MLAGLPGPVPRPAIAQTGDSPPAPRLPGYRLPIAGRVVTGTGEISDAGIHARGLTLEANGPSDVVAPAPGRVAYAGRFRGYGEIVIIDHGGGWTSLVTNLAARGVETGASVAAGAPIGRTGAGRSRVSVELRFSGRPVAITPMLG
jgi:septal ring factor EnvC (AmiA/AmiB activator)